MDNNVDTAICGECEYYNEFDETCSKRKFRVLFTSPACADRNEIKEDKNNG